MTVEISVQVTGYNSDFSATDHKPQELGDVLISVKIQFRISTCFQFSMISQAILPGGLFVLIGLHFSTRCN